MDLAEALATLEHRIVEGEKAQLEFAAAMHAATRQVVDASLQGKLALTMLAAAIARQPGVDAAKLLADFDAEVERGISGDTVVPVVMTDIRSALATIAKERKA